MYKNSFGTKGQIRFDSEGEYYETLGFLAKSDGTTALSWEYNEEQGAWGSEGRIQCFKNINKFPTALSRAFTAGTGRAINRINCNDFVMNLRNDHSFVLGEIQNRANIEKTIPDKYKSDFERGLNK